MTLTGEADLKRALEQIIALTRRVEDLEDQLAGETQRRRVLSGRFDSLERVS